MTERAWSSLAEGRTDDTVELSCAFVTRELNDRVPVRDKTIYWEFYSACQELGLADGHLERFHVLTESYERVTFTRRPIPDDIACEAVETAFDEEF
jgi:hypothetical protein